MGQNPINLGVRFILEILALVSMGYWGWAQGSGVLRIIWAIAIPVIAAALWGVFRVPNDPGQAPVAIPGLVRLALEIAFFGFATWALYTSFSTRVGWVFGLIVLVHYAISYDRILWLLKQW